MNCRFRKRASADNDASPCDKRVPKRNKYGSDGMDLDNDGFKAGPPRRDLTSDETESYTENSPVSFGNPSHRGFISKISQTKPMNPDRIGHYEILKKIGSGGMGNVYLATDSQMGRQVAVKVLSASLAREEGFIDRFNREIDALRKLKNPHIVELYENGVEGENYYFAMEYVEGETLMDLLRREKRLPWRRAFEIAVDVCVALKAAHDTGIIHRDLKPSNLLVTRDGFVKLTDFGVAQIFATNRLTVTGGIIGTAEYMSPEQAAGKRAGKQSDLYSLGAVLYAMITGRTPFSGSTAVEVIQKHKYGVFDKPRHFVTDLPNRVDQTICKLLEKEPEKRFPDALVLLRHLEQTMELENYSATDVTVVAGSHDAAQATIRDTPGSSVALSSESSEPGPATLMQSLMRAELSQVIEGGVISAFFNNTYVLVTLLVLIVAGGVWFWKSKQLTPSEMFANGEKLLSQEPSSEWSRARREYFEPLITQDPKKWGPLVEPMLKKIDLYESTRPGRAFRSGNPPVVKTECERLLQLAKSYRQAADLPRCQATLEFLSSILAGDDSQQILFDQVQENLEEVRGQIAAINDRKEFLEHALERAGRLAADGDAESARRIWQGIIDVYRDDPASREAVAAAQRELAEKSPASDPPDE